MANIAPGFLTCSMALLAAIALLAQDPQVPGDFKAKLKAKLQAKAAAAAQDATEGPLDPTKMAHLEGKVVDGAGNPVRTAEVRLARVAGNGQVPGLPGNVTTSDNEGKFVFDIEPSPNLSLTAQKAGYSQAKYGAKAPTAPVVMFGIRAGESMNDLVLTMIQQAVLTGRVVDDAGDPVAGALVTLHRRAYQQGVRRLVSAGSAPTNDLGEFRLVGLTDGRYYLVARDNQDRGNGIVSLPTFYPSATEESADPVEVKDGQDKGNLEIRLRTGKGYTVRGKVMGSVTPSGDVIGAGLVALPKVVVDGTLSSAGFLMPNGTVSKDGTFEVRRVVPGSYVVHLVTMTEAVGGGVSRRAIASPSVVVGGGDVSDVMLVPQPLFTITGRVSVEDATLAEMFRTVVNTQANNGTNPTTIDATGMRLLLYPTGSDTLTDQMTAQVRSDGSFTLVGVPPGSYAFQQGTIQKTSIKTVRWGDENVTEKGLVIDGNGTLEVVYRRGAVRTTGTIKNAKGEPHGGAQVVLWPVEPLPVFIANGIRNSTSDRNGAWNIGAVRPGFYYAAAFEDLETNIAQIRDFLDMFTGVVQKVEAKEGSPLMLTLDLIPAETVRKAVEKLP